MSQTEDFAMEHALPPPSYEEAVLGETSGEEQKFSPPYAAVPIHEQNTTQAQHYSAEQYPATQYSSPQHYMPQYNIQQIYTPYNTTPPGTELLCNLSEILVYPSRGRVFKIRDPNKVTIFTAKFKYESECCNCCNLDNPLTYTLRPVNWEGHLAQATLLMDSISCCSYSKRHLAVHAPLNVPVGLVMMHSHHRCSVENLSGDVLYQIDKEKSCCEETPYQITKTDGRLVGQIDYSRGIKHRITLPKEMSVQHKLLIIFYAVNLQAEADSQRRSD